MSFNDVTLPSLPPTGQAGLLSMAGYTYEELVSWTYRSDAVARCLVSDILQMQSFGGYFQLGNFPCRSAQLVGIIVGVQEKEKRILYTLDDGTGVIDCIRRRNLSERGPATGDTATCSGRIVENWGEKQLELDSIDTVHDPTAEPRHWLRVRQLHATLYRQLFVIPPLPVGGGHTLDNAKVSHAVPTAGSLGVNSSQPSSPVKPSMKLCHPSKVKSQYLTAEVFLLYVKDCIKMACEHSSVSWNDNPVDALSTKKNVAQCDADTVPKLCAAPTSSSRYLPRHGTLDVGACLSRTTAGVESPGITLSSLRRISPLAMLAKRVVHAEARRRGRQQGTGEHAGSVRESPPTLSREEDVRKAKRLFSWALRKLRQEGSIVLGIVTPKALVEIDTNLSVPWSSTASNQEFSTTSINLSARPDFPPLSPPSDNEETYLPVTPALLSSHLLEAFKYCLLKKGKKKGVSMRDLLSRMHCDERWEYLGAWNIEETLKVLEQEEKVCKMGGDEWTLI
ncbi:hypothetical protein CALCODRAFT_489816 [Calocera cornea HHB12733]|uniref:CST complex subunit STN1 n=1 Tax=Calocera cornea HHB12733 TaxID=1353952 RepID=A0A165JZ24_9BASI|nr:hypothetical protein CALCODRAFT_489816 [Calocera cornea HHB12733]